MNKESLEKIKDEVIKILKNEEIEIFDRVEIVINLMYFLDNYEEDLKVLKEYKLKKKK